MSRVIHRLLSLFDPTPVCGVDWRLSTLEASTNPAHVTCPACLGRLEGQTMPEADLLRQIRQLASDYGYLCHHHYDSRRSEPGWFDVALVKPGRAMLLLELKTARGKLTMDQQRWMDAVQQCTGVCARVVRPADLADVAAWLKGEQR